MGILGAKSQNLQKLSDAGFPVPKFFAVSSEALMGDFKVLAKKIHAELGCESYAVRSSALVEDTKNSAHAGEFKTVLDVAPRDMAVAMEELCTDAREKLGSLKNFALLVQEFIEPDAAGVFFTQHPGGDRGWVLEYHFGRGDKLVGGELKPIHKQGYWCGFTPVVDLPGFSHMLKQFKAIEELFGAPQDIEWCQVKGKTYLLQSRPITSIQGSLDWEKELPSDRFYFEKTEISEIAPKPDDETLELLEAIYKKGGPVHKVYEKFGVNYQAHLFFKLVDGELYVDKEAELKTLLPAYSFFKGDSIVPARLASLKGLWVTVKNLIRLNRLPVHGSAQHFEQIRSSLESKKLGDFFEDYALIFEINLLSACSLSKLTPLLARNKGITLPELLGSAEALFPDLPKLGEPPKGLVGNSLDLQDSSPFRAELKSKSNEVAPSWWNGLSSINKKILEPSLRAAVAYLRLREYARWLLVRHTNQIRPKRKKTSLELRLPKTLSSAPLESAQVLQCVSAGKAKGKLVNLEGVKKGEKGILLTKILSPNLVEFFPQLAGILSEEGGMLSHLAIMAREKGIPVLVGVDLSTLKLGQSIELEATNLSIESY